MTLLRYRPDVKAFDFVMVIELQNKLFTVLNALALNQLQPFAQVCNGGSLPGTRGQCEIQSHGNCHVVPSRVVLGEFDFEAIPDDVGMKIIVSHDRRFRVDIAGGFDCFHPTLELCPGRFISEVQRHFDHEPHPARKE